MAAVVKDSVFSLGVLKYVVCLCKGCDRCCVFLLYCDTWSCRRFVYGKNECFVMQMLYVCVHHVAVLNAAFCMICSLLMPGEHARGDNMEVEEPSI